MPKPYAPQNKKILYGTQPKQDAVEAKPIPRHCVICGLERLGEWYELMKEGWVCDPCRPKASHIIRDPQFDGHENGS